MQRLRDLALEVLNEYHLLSIEFGGFQQQTGLSCIKNCGACCNNPQVEASILEMLPLALHLFDTGQAESFLEQISDSAGFSCQLFQRHSLDGTKGTCTVYEWRPGICRMFGVAGYRTKTQAPTISVCAPIKTAQPHRYANALIAITTAPPPMLANGRQRIAKIDYALGETLLPINQALRGALEKVLLMASYSDVEDNNVAA
ncbi:YkgJ family cysteine cluster protein [Alteromonas ponticola]|uniref:YkgJ family cysteine cluster protein n=1 Tax=Alteromonas aquimaris TaxID=2998417 RepID=A0ABT3P6W5_9ALTE|nr:YkgJ family cysteine cluster protein [Alteromonas aquimaris]MCW8108270.1 YkgJ family cysteine cluster protein [Alteromonas aquimaris]